MTLPSHTETNNAQEKDFRGKTVADLPEHLQDLPIDLIPRIFTNPVGALRLKMQFPAGILPHYTTAFDDNSKTNSFEECPRKYFFQYVLGWRSKYPDINLIFGEAVHRALFVIYQDFIETGIFGKPAAIEKGIAIGIKFYREFFNPLMDDDNAPKNPFFLDQAIRKYIEYYSSIDSDFEILHAEVAGTTPIDDSYSMLFRIDLILRDPATRKVWCLDHKTAKAMTKVWGDQWKQASQFNLYTHALMMNWPPEEVGGAIVNGIFFRKSGPGFQRVWLPKAGTPFIGDWWHNVQLKLRDLDSNFLLLQKENPASEHMFSFPKQTKRCFDYFRPCAFLDFCMQNPNPIKWLEEQRKNGTAATPTNMLKDHWDPSGYADTVGNLLTSSGMEIIPRSEAETIENTSQYDFEKKIILGEVKTEGDTNIADIELDVNNFLGI
jgi:hypothetical protein